MSRLERSSRLARNQLTVEEQKELVDLVVSLTESIGNLAWLLSGEAAEIVHIEDQNDRVVDKSKAVEKKLEEIRTLIEADGPTDTPEQKAWEPDPDDLLPPGGPNAK